MPATDERLLDDRGVWSLGSGENIILFARRIVTPRPRFFDPRRSQPQVRDPLGVDTLCTRLVARDIARAELYLARGVVYLLENAAAALVRVR